jgi:hypothetical protein
LTVRKESSLLENGARRQTQWQRTKILTGRTPEGFSSLLSTSSFCALGGIEPGINMFREQFAMRRQWPCRPVLRTSRTISPPRAIGLQFALCRSEFPALLNIMM